MRTVSEGAVIARVNRVLAKEGEALHKARDRHEAELGQYYTTARIGGGQCIVEKDADLVEKARELGVLHDNEAIAG